MAQRATSDPDPLKPLLSATGVLRAKPSEQVFEADFARLAACFAAQTGGGLSPELSSDLALEIVLNEVVEQACLTTGATGAAIAIKRDGEMVCRASSGSTAPQLGARLDSAAGLSGECIRTRTIQHCDDVLGDPRVDLQAWQRLEVRSVIVMPLLQGEQLVGLFELLSSLPQAFGERDQRTLEALANRAVSSLQRASEPLSAPDSATLPEPPEVPNEHQPNENQRLEKELPRLTDSPSDVFEIRQNISEPVLESPEFGLPEAVPRREVDLVTWALRVAVMVCAIVLGLLLGRHLGNTKTAARPHKPIPVETSPGASTPGMESSSSGNQGKMVPSQALATSPPATASATSASASGSPPVSGPATAKPNAVPAGGLLVFENGKEIFRMPPQSDTGQNTNQAVLGGGVQRASSAEPDQEPEVSQASAEGSLLRRVEPQYPDNALQQRIQGSVVLVLHIGADGAVQDVDTVSGPPELLAAAVDAVKQWRFQPRLSSGHPAPMQTKVTLNFRLPQ